MSANTKGTAENDNLVLISGKSATGKSASLMTLDNPEGVVYLNCEGKHLPFKSKFKEYKITDPYQIYEAIEKLSVKSDVHSFVIDSLTYLMDMYETQYVINAADSRKEWGNYAQFFKQLIFNYVSTNKKNFIFLAHTNDIYNESELAVETMVKVKGSLMNNGIESYFSSVISTKKVPITKLKEFNNDYLKLTDDDKALGFKYVYQTKLTKETVCERIRSPLGMWSNKETFIDNNAQHVLNKLHTYYK